MFYRKVIQMNSSQRAVPGLNGTLISQTYEMAAPAAGACDSVQKLNHVINSIKKNLALIHPLYLIVSTFNPHWEGFMCSYTLKRNKLSDIFLVPSLMCIFLVDCKILVKGPSTEDFPAPLCPTKATFNPVSIWN